MSPSFNRKVINRIYWFNRRPILIGACVHEFECALKVFLNQYFFKVEMRSVLRIKLKEMGKSLMEIRKLIILKIINQFKSSPPRKYSTFHIVKLSILWDYIRQNLRNNSPANRIFSFSCMSNCL